MVDVAWWLSWYQSEALGPFTLDTPWWISGHRMVPAADTIVAAVRAPSAEAAWELILQAYDTRPASLEQRFCEPLGPGEGPFSSRFPRADWMQW
jgi:hypothetical protein